MFIDGEQLKSRVQSISDEIAIKSNGKITFEEYIEALEPDSVMPKSKLEVILKKRKEKEKQINSRKLYWKCQCDCGAIVSVDGTHLRRGETQSCGCIISRGEEKIANILSQNNIPYEKQKTFNSCVFDNGLMARFDFYINNKFLVEFDGLQHFKPGCFNQNEEAFIAAQQRDIFKNNWCLINNIPLKRIPYDALDTLSLEDIMGDKFLIERINNGN